MNNSKFKLYNFKPDPLHWAAANDWPGEVQKCFQDGLNPYRPNKDGLSPLHAAIVKNAVKATSLLLDRYTNDLAVVKEHMRKRFLWKTEANFWNKRPILIAWTDEDLQQVLSVASTCPSAIPLNVQIFVFLRRPCEGGQLVALDVCFAEKRLDVLRCVRKILPNGVLSLDKSDFRSDCMSYLQTACYIGSKELLVALISKGAQLSATGENGRIPLLTACETMKRDIIELLLTKYIDRYDPTVCDSERINAFHIVSRKDNLEITDTVLKSLIRYRTLHFGETESEAFNRTFPYEYSELDSLTTWTFMSSKMKNQCCKYVVQYKLDLTHVWRSNLNVLDLIARKLALDYCFEEIRRNPDILRMQTYRSMNMLQELLEYNHIEFVEEMYQENPTLKEEFNTAGAVEVLRNAVRFKNFGILNFILKHHKEYLQSQISDLEEHVISNTWYDKSVYQEPFSLLANAFPEMRVTIAKTIHLVEQNEERRSFKKLYDKLKNNFEPTISMLESEGVLANDMIDENGRNFLHQATDWDEKDLVMKLLDSTLDFNKKDNEGNLPIFLVRTVEVLDLFLAKMHVDPTTVNNAGYNLLHHSCTKGHDTKVLCKVLALGFDVNQATNDGNVPLSLASCCSMGNVLLKHGAAVELINGTALVNTFTVRKYCAVWLLLPKIAHLAWFEETAHAYLPWMLGNQNRDFFSCSCQEHLEKHPTIRKTLFDALYRHSKDQAAEFFLEVCHRAINCCARWFLDYGYDVDYELSDQYGYTPLIGLLAYMEEPNQDVVERLVLKGANVNAIDFRQRNALLVIASYFRSAQWYGHSLKTVELLLDHGAELDAQDEDGNTALHHAFENSQLELVELLIERGADTKRKNNENQLPYQKCPKNMVTLYRFIE